MTIYNKLKQQVVSKQEVLQFHVLRQNFNSLSTEVKALSEEEEKGDGDKKEKYHQPVQLHIQEKG